MSKDLIIFGAAEIADLAKFYFEADTDRKIVAFTVDDNFVQEDSLGDLPVVPFSEVLERFPPSEFDMHVAVSYRKLNKLREEKYHQAKKAGYALASFVCSKSTTWMDISLGDNCFVLENQTIQPKVKIGNNVMIWSGNHLGHGCSIGDHTYIASQVVISGHCEIGERNFLGVNATLRDFCTVGNDCFISMGAVISQDMPDGAVALAGSAKIYEAADRRARVLKQKYFGK